MPAMQVRRFWPQAGGWTLDVRSYARPTRVNPTLRPVLLIPGYCMNTTPLTFHPSGLSLIEYLTEQGFEVWTANLRGQGDSHSARGAGDSGFRDLALVDLPNALSQVERATESEQSRVDVIGCSLGGTYLYAYLAHNPETHNVGSVVGIGAPLSWPQPHGLLRTLFASPEFASRVRVSGTRRMARLALPVARRFPKLLSPYMNAEIVDLSGLDTLLATVEDPIPKLNGEIARWVKQQDLVVSGVNVVEALSRVDRPYLCIVANRDGIVPLDSAQSALSAFSRSESLVAGDDETWFAHADLFVSRPAQVRVFAPLVEWLLRQN
jgi:pimeloyl-ACP methyl ester carboxylesterase